MQSIRDLWNGLDGALAVGLGLVLIFVTAVVVERISVRVLRRAYARRVERAAAARGIEELGRIKRQRTLVTLLESLVRYGVYGAAVVVMLGMVTGGKTNALFGASLVVVLVGFGFQRLLGDVVAGALLLFEGHFAVGDVVTIHQHNVTGTVEEFSLRTTSLRTLGGDRVTVTNGSMASFTRWSYGQREFRIELIVRGSGGVEVVGDACAAEAAATGALWVRPPAVASTEALDGDLHRMYLTAVVAPEHELLVERHVAVLTSLLGDDRLVGPVTAMPLYHPIFEAWRSGLLLRD